MGGEGDGSSQADLKKNKNLGDLYGRICIFPSAVSSERAMLGPWIKILDFF